MTHFIEYYSCGHVKSQCRCAGVDKVKKMVAEPCDACKPKLKPTA